MALTIGLVWTVLGLVEMGLGMLVYDKSSDNQILLEILFFVWAVTFAGSEGGFFTFYSRALR